MNYLSLPDEAFGPLIERPFDAPASDTTIVRAYFASRRPTTVEAHRIGWNADRPAPVTGYRVLVWTPEQCASYESHGLPDPAHTAAHLDVVDMAARIAVSHNHPAIWHWWKNSY